MSIAPSPQFYDPFYRWEVRARPDDFSLLSNVHFVKPRHISSSEDAATSINTVERSAEQKFRSAAPCSSDPNSTGTRKCSVESNLHARQAPPLHDTLVLAPPLSCVKNQLSTTAEGDAELIQKQTEDVTDCPPVLCC